MKSAYKNLVFNQTNLLFPSSTIAIFPFSSTATPNGLLNSPGPVPCLPI